MELLIAILISLGVQIGPNGLDEEFSRTHQSEIIKAQDIANHQCEGGVIIDSDVSL